MGHPWGGGQLGLVEEHSPSNGCSAAELAWWGSMFFLARTAHKFDQVSGSVTTAEGRRCSKYNRQRPDQRSRASLLPLLVVVWVRYCLTGSERCHLVVLFVVLCSYPHLVRLRSYIGCSKLLMCLRSCLALFVRFTCAFDQLLHAIQLLCWTTEYQEFLVSAWMCVCSYRVAQSTAPHHSITYLARIWLCGACLTSS
jgi:hypothetical protein